MTLEQLGRVQSSRSLYEEAEAALVEALSIALDVAGPDGLETAEVWNGVALLRNERSEMEAAESAYLEALRIREERLGETDPLTIVILNNLGQFYIDAGKLEEAIEISRRALPSTVGSLR